MSISDTTEEMRADEYFSEKLSLDIRERFMNLHMMAEAYFDRDEDFNIEQKRHIINEVNKLVSGAKSESSSFIYDKVNIKESYLIKILGIVSSEELQNIIKASYACVLGLEQYETEIQHAEAAQDILEAEAQENLDGKMMDLIEAMEMGGSHAWKTLN